MSSVGGNTARNEGFAIFVLSQFLFSTNFHRGRRNFSRGKLQKPQIGVKTELKVLDLPQKKLTSTLQILKTSRFFEFFSLKK